MDGSELCEHVSYDITEMLRFLTTTSEQSFHGTAHCTPTQWHQFCAPLMLHWSLGPPLRFAQVDFRHNSAHMLWFRDTYFHGSYCKQWRSNPNLNPSWKYILAKIIWPIIQWWSFSVPAASTLSTRYFYPHQYRILLIFCCKMQLYGIRTEVKNIFHDLLNLSNRNYQFTSFASINDTELYL